MTYESRIGSEEALDESLHGLNIRKASCFYLSGRSRNNHRYKWNLLFHPSNSTLFPQLNPKNMSGASKLPLPLEHPTTYFLLTKKKRFDVIKQGKALRVSVAHHQSIILVRQYDRPAYEPLDLTHFFFPQWRRSRQDWWLNMRIIE